MWWRGKAERESWERGPLPSLRQDAPGINLASEGEVTSGTVIRQTRRRVLQSFVLSGEEEEEEEYAGGGRGR